MEEQKNAFHAQLTALEDESEFLILDPQIRQKLDNIDRMRAVQHDKENTARSADKPKKPKKSKPLEPKRVEEPAQPIRRGRESLEELRRN